MNYTVMTEAGMIKKEGKIVVWDSFENANAFIMENGIYGFPFVAPDNSLIEGADDIFIKAEALETDNINVSYALYSSSEGAYYKVHSKIAIFQNVDLANKFVKAVGMQDIYVPIQLTFTFKDCPAYILIDEEFINSTRKKRVETADRVETKEMVLKAYTGYDACKLGETAGRYLLMSNVTGEYLKYEEYFVAFTSEEEAHHSASTINAEIVYTVISNSNAKYIDADGLAVAIIDGKVRLVDVNNKLKAASISGMANTESVTLSVEGDQFIITPNEGSEHPVIRIPLDRITFGPVK